MYGILKRRHDRDFSHWAIRYGAVWFVVATLLQFAVGSWFLLSLPPEIKHLFMGDDGFATVIFVVALTCALASLALMLVGYHSAEPTSKVVASIVLITIICMVFMRDIVRDAYLDRYFDASKFSVEPQTSVIFLFFFLLLIGLGVIGYMLKKVATTR